MKKNSLIECEYGKIINFYVFYILWFGDSHFLWKFYFAMEYVYYENKLPIISCIGKKVLLKNGVLTNNWIIHIWLSVT